MLHLNGHHLIVVLQLLVADELLQQEDLQGEVSSLALLARGVTRAKLHLLVKVKQSYCTREKKKERKKKKKKKKKTRQEGK